MKRKNKQKQQRSSDHAEKETLTKLLIDSEKKTKPIRGNKKPNIQYKTIKMQQKKLKKRNKNILVVGNANALLALMRG